jgi:site-specific DNA-cytosine methylase
MKLLELFKGTGSVGKCFPEAEIYSVDIMKKYNPTFCGDIMDFDYKQFEVGHFDIIWASPECKIFSSLQHTHIGENRKWKSKEHLNIERQKNWKYVLKVLDIIDYLKPKYWFIENPWNSAMKDIPQMKDIKSYRLDYCRFGYPYNKPTRIWTNKNIEDNKCNCENKKHPFRLGMNATLLEGQIKDQTNQNQRYSIPPKLIDYLINT